MEVIPGTKSWMTIFSFFLFTILIGFIYSYLPDFLIFSFFSLLIVLLWLLYFICCLSGDASMFFYSTKYVSQDTPVFLVVYENFTPGTCRLVVRC